MFLTMGLFAHFFHDVKKWFSVTFGAASRGSPFLNIYQMNLWFVSRYYTEFLPELQV